MNKKLDSISLRAFLKKANAQGEEAAINEFTDSFRLMPLFSWPDGKKPCDGDEIWLILKMETFTSVQSIFYQKGKSEKMHDIHTHWTYPPEL